MQIAKESLMAEFALSDAQSQAIVDMRLRALTGLEREKLEAELKEMMPLEENRSTITLMCVPDLKERYYREIEEEFKAYALQLLEDL